MSKKNKRNLIIIISLSVLIVAAIIIGMFTQSLYADNNISVNADKFKKYIPYGVAPSPNTGKDVITVETGNPSLLIETGKDGAITNQGINANIAFINGKESNYISGLYNGSCIIKDFNDIVISPDKGSYEITLPGPEDLLRMNTGKDWLILSLDNDKSMLRTYAGLELSRLLGAYYTPDVRFIELFVNGSYEGTYMLCEKVEMDGNRLNISKAKPGKITGSALTGGYLMKTDSSSAVKGNTEESAPGKNFYFSMDNAYILPGAAENSRLKFRQTKNLSNEQFTYIKQYMKTAEKALFSENFNTPGSDDAYYNYFSINNIISWYINEEIFKNPNDPNYITTYLYKERDGGVSFGPVWYFGFGAGNSDFKNAADIKGWYVRRNSWVARMFEDERFKELFNSKWAEIKDNIKDSLFAKIDAGAVQLAESVRYSSISEADHNNEVKNLKDWLSQRIDWMNENNV